MGGLRRRSVMIAVLTVSFASCAIVVTQRASSAEGPVHIPSLTSPPFTMRTDVFPRALPKRTPAPVRLTIAGKVQNPSTDKPVLDELILDMDRSFQFNLGSLPPCVGPSLDRTRDRIGGNDEPDEVRAKCRSSIVAKGTAKFLLAFPENTPIPVISDLTLFMGDTRSGITTMTLHAYISIPTPQAILAPVELRKIRHGRYGTRATVSLPKIAGGYGRLTSFRLTIPREIAREGRPLNPVELRCADGQFQIEGMPVFTDGVKTIVTVVQPCATTPSRRHDPR